jgi:hypothetical protein
MEGDVRLSKLLIDSINTFYALKHKEAQRVNFEMTYVDIAKGDVIAGLLLSQIVYWFTPTSEGKSRTKVTYKGRRALAKSRDEWYDEIRITPRQYDRAIKILKDVGVVTVENSMYNAKRTPFIMLNEDVLLRLYNQEIERFNQKVKPVLPKSKTDIDKTGTPLTETNTETNNKDKRYKDEDVKNYQTESKDDDLLVDENNSSDIAKEALEFYKLMPRQDGDLVEFILVYRKLRSKYSKEYLALIIDRYKKSKKLKNEDVFHKPENFFRCGEYKNYLDENWENTLDECNKIAAMRQQKPSAKKSGSNEPQVTDEWDEQLEDLGW